MWHIESSEPAVASDVERFLDILNTHADFFSSTTPIILARAPGRLDVMGGIADYSGSLVLELPLAAATFVAVQPTSEAHIVIWSMTEEDREENAAVSLPLDVLFPADKPLEYADANTLLTADPKSAWMAYVAGVLVLLHKEYGVVFEHGLHIFIVSDVPIGKGVSSSAALEVATTQAVCAVSGLHLEKRDIALLCQRVENYIVGAPCGVMDQMTAACGEQHSLMALLCQPAELQSVVTLPSDIEVWGIDSGIRHAVTGADYGSVRVGAFMGYRIIAEHAGLAVRVQEHGHVLIDDPLWHGYLANIPPSLWETAYREHVPVVLDGETFLARYGGSTDLVTRVDPRRTYAVRQATAHPIYEHARVRLFRALLGWERVSEEQLSLLGELMYQSHASYSACGLGSDGTDTLVELVRQAGPKSHLYGAKITGGGSGGTVAVLARRGVQETIQHIATQYEVTTGHRATVLGGSSAGVAVWRVV
ncbi:MAG: galactokinase [Ktedonobacteraceae bacterium]